MCCAIFACASAPASNSSPDEFNSRIQTQEDCLSRLKDEIRQSVAGAPSFGSLLEAVRWTKNHIPSEYQEAFRNAGKDMLKKIGSEPIEKFADNKKQLWNALEETTFLSIANMPEHRSDGCSSGAEEALANSLDMNLRLGKAQLGEKFKGLNMTDSYQVDYAFLFMITLDSTNIKWDENWFYNFHH